MSSERCGIIPVMQPSAMAPNARIPDSLISHSWWKSISFRIGTSTGSNSSRNTLASTSSAAALHFLRFQSDKELSSSIPSSSSSSSSPFSSACLIVWVRDLWNLGLMSSSRSGIISSSSTSPLSNITSISEYFIPWTRIGTSLVRCGDNASLQIGWSANDSQNSQASKATLSSGSWVRINMYSIILWMWGISLSILTSSSITRARHTFLRTSGSSSVARWKRFSKNESMWIINAWVLVMINWFTQAIAWDLIFGLECLKNCRNFGMRTLSGRLSASLSSNSAESSQIFWSAPNEPSQTL